MNISNYFLKLILNLANMKFTFNHLNSTTAQKKVLHKSLTTIIIPTIG